MEEISRADCYSTFVLLREQSGRSKFEKGATFENVVDILNEYDIIITKTPGTDDLCNRKKWQEEHKKIMKAFRTVLTQKVQKGQAGLFGIFYKPSDYKVLTKHLAINDIDFDLLDIQTESESESESESNYEPPKKRGRHTVPLRELDSIRQLRRRTQKAFDWLISYCEEEGIDFFKLLAYFGRRFYLNSNNVSDYNLEKGTMFDDIFKGKNLYEYKRLLPKQGLWVMSRMKLGKGPYTQLRMFLDPYVHLPNTDDLRQGPL